MTLASERSSVDGIGTNEGTGLVDGIGNPQFDWPRVDGLTGSVSQEANHEII